MLMHIYAHETLYRLDSEQLERELARKALVRESLADGAPITRREARVARHRRRHRATALPIRPAHA